MNQFQIELVVHKILSPLVYKIVEIVTPVHFRKLELLTSQNGLKVAKAGHKSKGLLGMMADRQDG